MSVRVFPLSMHLVAAVNCHTCSDFRVGSLCLGQTPIPLSSLVKCTELSQAVGFLALVSGLAIGSAVDDSKSRDRLILFLSGCYV